ncbi:helix-turn-helix domain-containing protein [Yunchengibacter salinarum]|uniref:helix-turn-helix domain-containing protein n=1 Tax=Yunchengibacter salinarum TaxID=3133399 RepID=UPI0035B671FF
MPIDDPDWLFEALTTDEAAKVLGSTSKTLTTWRCRKRGPRPRYLGRKVVYLRVDLLHFLRTGRHWEVADGDTLRCEPTRLTSN